jgi:hypothetical protein
MDTNLRKQTTTDDTDGTDWETMTRLRPAAAGLRRGRRNPNDERRKGEPANHPPRRAGYE